MAEQQSNNLQPSNWLYRAATVAEDAIEEAGQGGNFGAAAHIPAQKLRQEHWGQGDGEQLTEADFRSTKEDLMGYASAEGSGDGLHHRGDK